MKRLAMTMCALALVAGPVVATQSAARANDGGLSLSVRKVDGQGNLLPGATIAATMCTRPDEESPLDCTPIQGDWCGTTLTTTGRSDDFAEHISMFSYAQHPIVQCVAVREISAPAGYSASTTGALVCAGPGGWTAENATGLSADVAGVSVHAGLGDWTISNHLSPSSPNTRYGVLTLTNKRLEPPAPPASPAPPVPPATPAPVPSASTSTSISAPPSPSVTRPALPHTGVADVHRG